MAPAKAAPFLKKWLDDYSWLVYDKSKDAAFCTICQLANANTMFGRSGYVGGPTKRFLYSTIKAHSIAEGHTDSVKLVSQAAAFRLAHEHGQRAEKRKMETATSTNNQEAAYTERYAHALRCAYFLAKHRLPYRLMAAIAELVSDTVDLYTGGDGFATSSGAFKTYSDDKRPPPNLVKTDNRTSLSASHLQDLMWIAAKEQANAKRRQV
ncbi:hypothetical protein SPRG_15234 [Saprolegnia parasitica CBS 223.65]|uniref:C17orf113 probable zinc finger domain-containing protein n=1 Tax=Saprolegnia parasitica (strain CBS 223.65) TaxID=695850 RepID=A0A067BR76_SAPPC|nr:hypothetical protein SPRG_15234 [Saprolegnia parasitica CBS 223.65]KDO19295.1 hypothetical protein SPRG_15234 [Saprolegnia parasitica CBS 223.65]|eukprot:XP_012210006.1 hypothetical protein SPRG_15234 [Saprolegnia parasitica CBS 223.65]